MHVRFSPLAESDLDDIHDYISTDDPVAAQRVIDRILSAATYLETFPLLGRTGRVEGTRELSVPRIPYIVIYTLPDTFHVDVERVLHGARKWPPHQR